MNRWEELVTTALLGTDRRPVAEGSVQPDLDPVDLVLSEAARHRAAVRAGRILQTCPPPDWPPGPVLAPAPPLAQDKVAEHLGFGDVAQVNAWLSRTAEQGSGLAAEHWVAAATLAARAPGVNRRDLAAVLGRPGVWFLSRNPEWAQLAAALHTALNESPG
jgi:hypothetical protein